MHLQKIAKRCKTTEGEIKQRDADKKKRHSPEVLNETFTNTPLPVLGASVFLRSLHCELWAGSLRLRGSPPSIFKQALWTHSTVFPYEASLCVSSLPRPPTHTFYLFIVDSCSTVTWPHVYLCFSSSPAFPTDRLLKPCFHCVMSKFEEFCVSKGAIILCSLFLTWY